MTDFPAIDRRWTGLVLMLLAAALSLTALASTARANEARITDEKQLTDRVVELTIETPAFTAPTIVQVFLPTGYDDDPDRRWPVAWYTSGTANGPRWFNEYLGGEELSKNHPAIIVSPDGKSGYWSDHFNTGAFGPPKYETYVIDQLIPLIDEHFRTIPDREHRVIFGISMGGFGSMMLAAHHPELFSAAASLSGAVDSNIPLNGLVLSASSMFDGAPVDSIYGPRATQEIRWRGHNPWDLAENLRGLDLQIRTANGTPNTEIGEADDPMSLGCASEGAVHAASVNLHDEFDRLGIKHVWNDRGAGCHVAPTFQREVTDTLAAFEKVYADPPAPPESFEYRSFQPAFDVYGWHVDADPKRALEFMKIQARPDGATLEGSGKTNVTTPPWYRGLKAVDVNGKATRPQTDGRLRFPVDLGAANNVQQYSAGFTTTFKSRKVTFKPHAIVRITKAKRTGRGVRVCAKVIGGEVPRARIKAGKRSVNVKLGPKKSCRTLRVRPKPSRVTVSGKDRFGHPVKAKAAVRR